MTTPQRPLRTLGPAIIALAAALVLAGCVGFGGDPAGTDPGTAADDPDPVPVDDGNTSSPSDGGDAGACEDLKPSPNPGQRTVDHAAGKTTVDGPSDTVVALEYNHVENLLALEITPAGVTNPDGYEKWVGTEPLPENVTDVGSRSEPNLETITKLDPDLILAVEFRHKEIYDDLSDIAPTLLFQAFPPEDGPDQFARMQSIFNRTAKATARQDRGNCVIDEMQQDLDEAADEVAALDKAGREILVTQVFTHQDTPIIRAFSDNSIPIQIAQRLGLVNAWPKEYERFGFTRSNKEGMKPVDHADFFYQAQPDDNPVEDEWDDDPVWNSYEFVQEDRVYPLGAKTWLFGGPIMTEQIADRIVGHYKR